MHGLTNPKFLKLVIFSFMTSCIKWLMIWRFEKVFYSVSLMACQVWWDLSCSCYCK